MTSTLKNLSAIVLSLSMASAIAAPTYLITHNNTNEESNAFIDNSPSPFPTAAHSSRSVYWNLVRLACYHYRKTNLCPAVIKMATNTSKPITLGTLTLNLETGDISPKKLTAGGYTLIVNGLGEATVIKN